MGQGLFVIIDWIFLQVARRYNLYGANTNANDENIIKCLLYV